MSCGAGIRSPADDLVLLSLRSELARYRKAMTSFDQPVFQAFQDTAGRIVTRLRHS
jgi:hypothetical protein